MASRRVWPVLGLLRAAYAHVAQGSLPWRERQLAAVCVSLSLTACRFSEKARHRTHRSVSEHATARLFLVLASVVAVCCRLLVSDRRRFMRILHAVRSAVFREHVDIDIPLVVLSILWHDTRAAVVHTTCVNFEYLYVLAGTHTHFLVSAYWMKFRANFLWHRSVRMLADPFETQERAVWLGNSPTEVRNARAMGCKSVFVNNNCFINTEQFQLRRTNPQPRFDAVLNANAGAWKRHELARDITSFAYITYSRGGDGRLIWPVESFQPAWRNDTYLDEGERREIYNASCCGLILSACEGANYSTVEFLLCGIPVVSTESIGGRAVWLTEANSTICGASPGEVAAAVAEWRTRHEAGLVDAKRIREECLALVAAFRTSFIASLQAVLDSVGANADAEAIFAVQVAEDALMHALSFQRSTGARSHPFCNGKAWFPLAELPAALHPSDIRAQ